MQTIPFHTNKYGRELLMDLGKIENVPQYFAAKGVHTVDFYEIFFLRKAAGTLRLDNNTIPLKNGLIIYATPYQRRLWQVNAASIEGYYLIFANNFLELLFADPLFVFRLQFFHNYQHPPYIDESHSSQLKHNHAFQNILHELNNLQDDSEDFIRAFLLLILAGHNRVYCRKHGLNPNRSQNPVAFQFKKLVEQYIRKNESVDGFAARLKMSRVTLNKIVKAKFGLSPMQLIKKRLLVEVQRELLYTNKTIAQIAYELNFAEHSSLTRMFTKAMGQSPGEFRLAYQTAKQLNKV